MCGFFMDFFMQDSVITILGNGMIVIENYRRILEYSDCKIRIQTKKTYLHIIGQHLEIKEYCNEEMIIQGQIKTINFGQLTTE